MGRLKSLLIDYADKHDISTDEALSRLEAEGARIQFDGDTATVITEREFEQEYNPDTTEITARGSYIPEDHDCHAEGGESGCLHPSHKEEQ